MDSVELVKKICKEQKIPISRLEQECGFSNGYIRKLKEGKFPTDRIQKIADFLDVSVDYLLTGEKNIEMTSSIRHNPLLADMIPKYLKLLPDEQALVRNLVDTLASKNS